VHFYGGTLWFKDSPLNQIYENQLNDFNLIGDIHDWVYEKNTEFRVNGNAMIRPETVVLSHHLPSPICVAEQYRGDELNRFFVSDETSLILEKQPRIWVFGHTHHRVSMSIGNTILEANPYGYPQERKFFPYPSIVMEI